MAMLLAFFMESLEKHWEEEKDDEHEEDEEEGAEESTIFATWQKGPPWVFSAEALEHPHFFVSSVFFGDDPK